MHKVSGFLQQTFAVSVLVGLLGVATLITHNLTPVAKGTVSAAGNIAGVSFADLDASKITNAQPLEVIPISQNDLMVEDEQHVSLVKSFSGNRNYQTSIWQVYNPNPVEITANLTARVPGFVQNAVTVDFVGSSKQLNSNQQLYAPGLETLTFAVVRLPAEQAINLNVKVAELKEIYFPYEITFNLEY